MMRLTLFSKQRARHVAAGRELPNPYKVLHHRSLRSCVSLDSLRHLFEEEHRRLLLLLSQTGRPGNPAGECSTMFPAQSGRVSLCAPLSMVRKPCGYMGNSRRNNGLRGQPAFFRLASGERKKKEVTKGNKEC
jgi:hypothetical protein